MNDPALETQKEYYQARAPEYDDWWLRRGRYDRGPVATAAWREETATLTRWLTESKPSGAILKLACGTGIWTEKLLGHTSDVTCVDASSAMLECCANRVGESAARFGQAASSTASDHALEAKSNNRQTRRLDDGREFEIFKVFHDPARLAKELQELDFETEIRTTKEYFLAGCGQLQA